MSVAFSAVGDLANRSAVILDYFRQQHGKDINLTLRTPYRDLLAKLGNPHTKLPPVMHVAGTNGKGSTCAFLRAMVEAAGYKAHVYTSPHLVTFHERIRIAGQLIGEDELADILQDCQRLASPGGVSYFEAATAAAFVAFARHPADITILEVGLGGRLDSTNVIPTAAASLITRLSYDHREYLGETLAQIAHEKAGIMRPHIPCFTAPQPAPESLAALQLAARTSDSPLHIGGEDWRIEAQPDGTFSFTDFQRTLVLPRPALAGQHQLWNAGLAIAATAAMPLVISPAAIATAMHTVSWPARLQPLTVGKLPALLPAGWELWLDGGHNDSAGEVLAAQARHWRQEDGAQPKPLRIIFGMLATKAPQEFLAPLQPYIDQLCAVAIPDEPLGQSPELLAQTAQAIGIKNVTAAPALAAAFDKVSDPALPPGRVLVCGSLYLAGRILRLNQEVP